MVVCFFLPFFTPSQEMFHLLDEMCFDSSPSKMGKLGQDHRKSCGPFNNCPHLHSIADICRLTATKRGQMLHWGLISNNNVRK